MRDTLPHTSPPFWVMQSIQSIPSVWPLSHIPPSEIGSSSTSKRVLYDLTGSPFMASTSWMATSVRRGLAWLV